MANQDDNLKFKQALTLAKSFLLEEILDYFNSIATKINSVHFYSEEENINQK